MATTPREWAHELANRGLKVHPVWWIEYDFDDEGGASQECACSDVACKSAGKHPIFSTTLSSSDSAQIESWWRDYPEANLGVNTEGIAVVDVDPRHAGDKSYATLQPDLAPTFTVRTGGGGWQEYYAGELEGKTTGKLAPGIDFKSGPTQQVVGPGSVHVSGLEYTVVRDGALAPTPSRVRELAGWRQPAAPGLAAETAIPTGVVGPGYQNDALTAVAAAMRNHANSFEELLGYVVVWARMHCDPYPDEARLREIVEHRFKNHDGVYVPLDAAAPLFAASLHPDGSYAFDDGAELDAIFDGTYEPPAPTILARADGGHLLYPKAINTIFGEDSIGKTWVGIAAAREVLDRGGKVVHLDWDDAYATCAHRLKLLGAKLEDVHARYLHKTSPSDVRPFASAILLEHADLIIIDVVANAVAASGLNEDKAQEYLQWAEETAVLWARADACVLLNDHVTKGEGRHAFARGSGAKRGGVDGAAFELRAAELLLPGEGGELVLRVAKDRHGGLGVRRGEDIARLVFDAEMQLQILEPEVPEEQVEAGVGLRMAIGARADLADGFTRRDVEQLLGVERTAAQRNIDQLVAQGHALLIRQGAGPVPNAYRITTPAEAEEFTR